MKATKFGFSPAALMRGRAPLYTVPLVPFRVIQSPSRRTVPLTVTCRVSMSTWMSAGADDAALAPAARHEGRVGGHAAAGGEDALRRAHAFHVLGVGLLADEDDLLALLGPLHGVLRGEDDLADRAAGTGGKPLGEDLGCLLLGGVDDGVQELVELGGGDARDGLLGRR